MALKHIIQYLFCDAPTSAKLKNLVAFFYGNGIPCPLACQLYHACNGQTDGNVTEYLYGVYDTWQKLTDGVHFSEYYNVRIGKYICINGCNRDQLELVSPQPSFVQLGIENTQFPKLIKSEIERVKEIPYY
jgi:hypothetical protein